MSTQAAANDPATVAGSQDPGAARAVLRPVVQLLGNITVVTALLVYFGWRRSATQSERLGLAESILEMSTSDYLLRSVRPVLVLLVGVSAAGLAWVALDRYLAPRVRAAAQAPPDASAHRLAWLVRGLGCAWLLLPSAVWLLGWVARPLAFVLFPASIGVGVLLLLYAAQLRRLRSPTQAGSQSGQAALQVFAVLLAGVCLFWTAANYAQVEGVQLARAIASDITGLPGVRLYSERRLHLDGPGVQELPLPHAEGEAAFRYEGLRLLEHTGDRYFLVSDGWTPTYGVLFVLPDDDADVRLEFVRDLR